MALFDTIRAGASGAGESYEVERSLRFDRNSSAYLGRTAGSPTNSNKFSYSCWVKRTKLGQGSMVMMGGGGGSQTNTNAEALLYFVGEDEIAANYKGGLGGCTIGWFMKATSKLRDVSAWYHLLAVWDGSLSGDSNRMKFFINGVQESLAHDCGSTSAGFQYVNQNGSAQYIGRMDAGSGPYYSSFYLAEAYFVDGTACTPSDFIETDSTTGQIAPQNSSAVLAALTMGNNGFYLNFSDNSDTTASTLGKDYSGNGNNWTPYNFSVSGTHGNDSLEDSPTNNFPTFNPINSVKYSNNYSVTVEQGNLLMRGGDNYVATTFLLPKSGKWYVEFSKYGNGAPQAISVTRANKNISGYDGALGLADMVQYVSNGELGNRSRGSTSNATVWQDDADIVVAIAVDMDNGAVYFARANTWQNSGNPTSGASKTGAMGTDIKTDNGGDHVIAAQGYNGNDNYGMYVNFGQRAFTYTPPTGYEKLCSANLSDPAVKLPNNHFDILLYTGTGSSHNVTGLEFQPDWTWIKKRSGSDHHNIADAVRGAGISLRPSNANAETSTSGAINAFLSNGFTVVDAGETNESGYTYVAWNWNAGGSTVTNTDGTISAQVRANASAGFSISTYTANGTAGATIGHGLGVKPDLIIIKCRSNSDDWMVYHKGANSYVDPEDYYLTLNGYAADVNSPNMLNDTAPTSSVITLNNDGSVNSGSRTYVMYSFSEIEGYSKFGRYVGNGNSNGTYVFTGFRPTFVITRGLHGTSWYLWDSSRNTYNPVDKELNSNNTQSEATFSNAMDFLSNGFKLRTSNDGFNYNNYDYIYIAFAEAPFKNARAR